ANILLSLFYVDLNIKYLSMTQLKEIKEEFIEAMKGLYDSQETSELYWLSLEHVLELDRVQLKLNEKLRFNEAQISQLQKILGELVTGRPLQHIIGYSWFYGEKFIVNKSVLIPRPETEELVAWIIDDATQLKTQNEPICILDIGTGSGFIPIILKKKIRHRTQIHAVDISPEALEVAKENAESNKADIDFLQLDILQAEPYVNQLNQKFDIIVSNPPYISREEESEMHSNVLDHEPHQALFVDQEDPLIFYKSIADFALKNLHDRGRLYFEINQRYGNILIDYLTSSGFKDIVLSKDISGNDRMIRASLFS